MAFSVKNSIHFLSSSSFSSSSCSNCRSSLQAPMFEDHISQLPDAILVSILSLLTLREAAITSLLSRRWRYLWTYVQSLDFDPLSFQPKCIDVEDQRRYVKMDALKYVSWLNNVVESHRGSNLEHFKAIVCSSADTSQVYRWISFALMKRTKVLELDFRTRHCDDCDFSYYLYRCVYSNPDGMSWIKSLKTLILSGALVTAEILEFLFSNCPQLITLQVRMCGGPVNLRIDNDHIQHLQILYCHNIKSIEIVSAQNLVSFAYKGATFELYVKNAPSLVRLDIGSNVRHSSKFACDSFAESLPQLNRLKVSIIEYFSGYISQFPDGDFPKLKQLVLNVDAYSCEIFLDIICLIERSTSLEKFTLLFDRHYNTSFNKPVGTPKKEIYNFPHYHLKDVKFVGFTGCRGDSELVQYLLDNAVNMEKFVLDINKPYHVTQPNEYEDSKRKFALKRAKELVETTLHRKIDFISIINYDARLNK